MAEPDYPSGTTRVAAAACPHCGKMIDAATAVEDPQARPEPGAVTFCSGCRGMSVFAEEGALRMPTLEEACSVARQLAMRTLGERWAEEDWARRVRERIVEIVVAQTDGGKALIVRAEGAVNAGMGLALLCQTAMNMSDFPAEVRQAAKRLLYALVPSGKTPPFEIYRGQRGGA